MGFLSKIVDPMEEEKARIAFAAEEAKKQREEELAKKQKNLIRKIGFADKMLAKHDETVTQRIVERAKFEEKKKIAQEKSERRQEWIKSHKLYCIMFIVLVVAIAGIINQIAESVATKEYEEHYSAVVAAVKQGNYKEAMNVLGEFECKDKGLIAFVKLQNDIDSYKGKPGKFYDKIVAVNMAQNGELQKIYNNAKEKALKIKDLQKDINNIDTIAISLDDQNNIRDLTLALDEIDKRYRILLDTEKLDIAQTTLDNLTNATAVGLLIQEIRNLGPFDESKSEEVNSLMGKYEALSAREKAEVINYSDLRVAKDKVNEIEEARVRQQEEAAKAAAIKAQSANTSSSNTSSGSWGESNKQLSWDDNAAPTGREYYWTATGKRYHTNRYCSGLSNANNIFSGPNPPGGLSPCKKCC